MLVSTLRFVSFLRSLLSLLLQHPLPLFPVSCRRSRSRPGRCSHSGSSGRLGHIRYRRVLSMGSGRRWLSEPGAWTMLPDYHAVRGHSGGARGNARSLRSSSSGSCRRRLHLVSPVNLRRSLRTGPCYPGSA